MNGIDIVQLTLIIPQAAQLRLIFLGSLTPKYLRSAESSWNQTQDLSVMQNN